MQLNIENTVDRIKELIQNQDEQNLQEELDNLHHADIAEVFEHISEENRVYCFNLIDEDTAALILDELNPQTQVELLDKVEDKKAARIILKMPHDSMADVLGEVEDDDSEVYLNRLPSRISSQIRELLKYDEDTAGGIMNSQILSVGEDMSVKDTLDFLRIKADKDKVDLYYIYVVDKFKHLLGVLSLRQLLTTPLNTKIENIMTTDLIKVNVDDDQEVVADTLIKYNFLAIPVVDHYNRLKGMVTWDDAQEVNEEETTEEIYTSSGIATDLVDIDEEEILSGGISSAIRARSPWLLITLLGEIIAVNVANYYDATLHALPIIAIFMPLLAGLGGNIGTQSITLMVRGLSTGQVNLNSAMHHIFREFRIGLFIGVCFGILTSLFTWGWKENLALGAVVGTAMTINMTLATVIGTITPFILKKMKIDPAIASGPVIATTIDVIGLAVYFTLVTVYLVHLV